MHGESSGLWPQMVLSAYREGFFPMAHGRDGPIEWFSPDPRAILPLDRLHIARSLGRRLRRGVYRITSDRAFDRVVDACSQPRPHDDQTWISRELIEVYTQLHRMGWAHSIEAWPAVPDHGSSIRESCERQQDPVGGLYGVSMGGVFFAESMFSRSTDASKVCLVHLVRHLLARGYRLLDVQYQTPHLERFGVTEVSRRTYLSMLADALKQAVTWSLPPDGGVPDQSR